MNEHAQSLGRLAKGKPKSYSEAELAKRRQRCADMRERKAAKRLKLEPGDKLGTVDLTPP